MKVLVSGGTGLVGRYVVEELLAAGYSVIVGGRRAPLPRLFSRPVEFAPLSLDPETDHIDAFDDAYFFVHAAFSHLPGKYRGGEGDDPEGFRRLNLDGTVKLFDTAKRAGTRRCIFISSRAVYQDDAAGHRSDGRHAAETGHALRRGKARRRARARPSERPRLCNGEPARNRGLRRSPARTNGRASSTTISAADRHPFEPVRKFTAATSAAPCG